MGVKILKEIILYTFVGLIVGVFSKSKQIVCVCVLSFLYVL